MINADIILDKRRKAKNGYPVKIRIYDSNAAKGNLKSRHYINLNIYQDKVDRTDKVNHSQRMKVSIVKYVLKIDSSEYKFNNYFLIFCA